MPFIVLHSIVLCLQISVLAFDACTYSEERLCPLTHHDELELDVLQLPALTRSRNTLKSTFV